MTLAQRIAVVAGLLTCLLLVLWPPWYGKLDRYYPRLGRHPLVWRAPQTEPRIPTDPRFCWDALRYIRVDREQLSVEFLAVIIVTGAAVVLLGHRRRREEKAR